MSASGVVTTVPPNDLRAIPLPDDVAGQPGGVEKERSDQVRELVVHRYSPCINGDSSGAFVARILFERRIDISQ